MTALTARRGGMLLVLVLGCCTVLSASASPMITSFSSRRVLGKMPTSSRFGAVVHALRGGDEDDEGVVDLDDHDDDDGINDVTDDDVTTTASLFATFTASPWADRLRTDADALRTGVASWSAAVRSRVPRAVSDRFVRRPALVLGVGSYVLCSAARPVSNGAVVGAALLGSALGFVSFLYFISVGYGVGVALPAGLMLWAFNTLSERPVPPLTNLHTALVVCWGVRLAVFLLHREFVAWKQWHVKIKEVDQRSRLVSKFSVWTSCALFYSSLVTPCLYRMRQQQQQPLTTHDSLWGPMGQTGIALQAVGLSLETVADWQKARFKASKVTDYNNAGPSSTSGKMTEAYYSTVDDLKEQVGNNHKNNKNKAVAAPSNKNAGNKKNNNKKLQQQPETNRNRLCNVGLWKYFTHPNFLGDGMFWIGTYVAGMGALETMTQILVSTFGLLATIVVLRGATEQLDEKQHLNYRKDPDFLRFRASVGFLGPKLFKSSRT